MRVIYLPLLLLAVGACSRSHAPAGPPSGAALPPPPDAAIAQSVPAGGAPAAPGSVAAASSVGGAAAAEALAPPDKSDARWRDVDPNTLGGRNEDQLAQFQAEQRKRDAELMQHDAAEAKERVASGRSDEGDQRDDPRAYEDERYADPRDDRDDRYFDERERLPPEDPRYGDPRYDEPPYGEPPYDEPPFEQPPYDEGEDYPPPDEDYDPRYDERWR